MEKIKGIVGWISVVLMVLFALFCIWDYVTMKLENHERRIADLETKARPLIVVDKWAHVYLNAEEVPFPDDREQTTEDRSQGLLLRCRTYLCRAVKVKKR